MTCRHVIGLIDAGPLADSPREQLDAAHAHARGCATCGQALEAATALTDALRALSRPSVPTAFTDRVMARIVAIEQLSSVPTVVEGTRVSAVTTALSPWANATGLAASIVAVLWSMGTDGGDAALGATGMAISITPAAMPLFAAGLIVYVAGLFSATDTGR